MKRSADPPTMATWLLEHSTPGDRNDALEGDLLEEFRSGRSANWYWRQVVAAVVIGCVHEVLNHRTVLLFAAAWSMLVPGWLLIVAAVEQHFNLNARIAQLEFPESTVCDLGLLLAANLLFIWAGILVYLIPHLWFRRNLRVRPLAQGIVASIPVLIAVWAALIILPKQFLHVEASSQPSLAPVPTYEMTHTGPTEVRRVPAEETWTARYGDKPAPASVADPRNAIADMHKSALLVRLPFLLCVLCTLWAVTSRQRKRSNRVTT